MATTNRPYDFPPEHLDFLNEFQSLVKKYPRAARRFSLADLGEDGNESGGEGGGASGNVAITAAAAPTRVWECRRTQWGLECRKVPV